MPISGPPDDPLDRSPYGAPGGMRPGAFLVVLLLHGAVLTALLLRWSGSFAVAKPSAPLVVSLLPPASPPDAEEAKRERPVPERRKEALPAPPKIEQVDRTVTPLAPAVAAPPIVDPPTADPAPRRIETAAPKAAPAPPAPRASNDAPDSWEGRVLARLERFRRYPGAARGARQQGIAYIRFRLARDGHVLSASLQRSSGFAALDQAALETLRRADPLPKIPADRPDEIELSVPVEFYLR